MIALSLLSFLAGVALLAGGLLTRSLALEATSIAAALLAAAALTLAVRQRHVAAEAPDGSAGEVGGLPDGIPGGAEGGTAALVAERPVAPVDEPAEERVATEDVSRLAGRVDEVLVVDGRPRYHLAECPAYGGRPTIPLPVARARELGFTPCERCRPDATILSRAGPTPSAPPT